MVNEGAFTVHDFAGVAHRSAIGIADTLVPEAYSKDGQSAAEVTDDIVGDAGILRGGGAGGNDDGIGRHFFYLFQGYLIIARDS